MDLQELKFLVTKDMYGQRREHVLKILNNLKHEKDFSSRVLIEVSFSYTECHIKKSNYIALKKYIQGLCKKISDLSSLTFSITNDKTSLEKVMFTIQCECLS